MENVCQRRCRQALYSRRGGPDRVYFANVSIGNSITSTYSKQTTKARKYLVRSLVDSLDFREILRMAGATVVDQKPGGEYIDLSPERLDKTTIIDLINPQANKHLPAPPSAALFVDAPGV